uniref:Glutathione S-transferase 1-like n=1 Tax=Glossina austeni TaxID=7395 RepID=A0A1A9VHV3_GLOAU
MGKLILYGIDLSPPVRACRMTLKELNLPFEYKIIDLSKGEHLTDEYCAKNPQHTVPTLEDDGHIIWDSHAIMTYLVNKYGKENDSLYPKDLLKRAIVDQRLHLESGVIFEGGLRSITSQIFSGNDNNIPRSKINAILKIYDLLEVFLKSTPYVAGSNLTIADFSIVSTVTTLAFIDIDDNKYPKLSTWLKRMESSPHYHETNGSGAQRFVNYIKSRNIVIID